MAAAWLDHVKVHGCGALPVSAERELMAASKHPAIGRMRAIDRAYERTSNAYPHLFRD